MTLPPPDFIARDPAAITAEMVAEYERITGRALQPAQVERLLINAWAYRESLVRMAVQETAEQNMVAFARYPMLDHLGRLLGVARLPAQRARAVLRFIVTEPQPADVVVPAGTRVETRDGKQVFELAADLRIPAGHAWGEGLAFARQAGVDANGYGPGEISRLRDPVAHVASAANVSVAFGGADLEDDERLRARIQEAPERFSVAGPVGAYRWHAMTAHQDIIDAAVVSPTPGSVHVHILAKDGMPNPDLLAEVQALLSDDKVRPLTDHVLVLPPNRIPYALAVQVTLYRTADQDGLMPLIDKAAAAYAAQRAGGLGRDLVPSQIIAALSLPGVYRVDVLSPAHAILEPQDWPECTGITVTLAGVVDG